jgi:hypothetical protein
MPSNIGAEMEIRCHASKRFLLKINLEEYLEDLKRFGISQQTPLEIEVPCKTCKTIEVYELYRNNIKFIKSYKKV